MVVDKVVGVFYPSKAQAYKKIFEKEKAKKKFTKHLAATFLQGRTALRVRQSFQLQKLFSRILFAGAAAHFNFVCFLGRFSLELESFSQSILNYFLPVS